MAWVFVSAYQNNSSRVTEFLCSTTVLYLWKSQKEKKKPNYPCFLTYYLQNSAKSYYIFEERQGHTQRVWGQKRVNFRDHSNWRHSENGAWKINYFFISSKIKHQGLMGCVTPQEQPKVKNPSPPLSPPGCASHLIVHEALIFVTWKWHTHLLILEKQMTVTAYHNHQFCDSQIWLSTGFY